MAGLAKTSVVKKAKKHGVKAGQKSKVKPSQKKSVKNGRHQEKEVSKAKVKKAVKSIPAGLDGAVTDDEIDEACLEQELNGSEEDEEIYNGDDLDGDDLADDGLDEPEVE